MIYNVVLRVQARTGTKSATIKLHKLAYFFRPAFKSFMHQWSLLINMLAHPSGTHHWTIHSNIFPTRSSHKHDVPSILRKPFSHLLFAAFNHWPWMISGTSRVAAGNATKIQYILRSHRFHNHTVGLFARVPSGPITISWKQLWTDSDCLWSGCHPALSEEPWFFQT